MPRTGRDVGGEPVLEIGDAISRERRNHECCRETGAVIGLLGNGKQRRLLDEIDLVEHQHLGLPQPHKSLEKRNRLLVDAAPDVNQYGDKVGVLRPRPGGRDHGAVETPSGKKNAGVSTKISWAGPSM